MSVVQALANAKAFKAEEFPQAYLESQKFLITADDGTRRIHPIAAYLLLATHPADKSDPSPLLFRVGTAAVALRDATTAATAATLTAVIAAYEQLQKELQELDKRQEAIARLTAMFSIAAIEKKALKDVAADSTSYVDVLKTYNLETTADKLGIFSNFLSQLSAGGDVYRALDEVKGLQSGILFKDRLFSDATKQHVNASLQSGALAQK